MADISRPRESVEAPRPGVLPRFLRGVSAVWGPYGCGMRSVEWLTLLVALVAGILIPVLILVARQARHSGVIEQKLDDLANSEATQDRRVAQIFEGLDRRLRWLEERLWGRDPRYPRDKLPVSAGGVGSCAALVA